MTLIVTQAGLDKVVQADISGISLIIAEVGIGLNGYTPDSTMTALQNESVRKALTGGKQVSSNQIQLQVLLDNEDEIVGREVGFYLDDGTLFAIDSDPDDIITYKSASSGSKALETFDLVLDSLPPDSVTVTVTGDLTVHEDDPNPHPQYELANNNASDSDIDAESTDDKHINLPQFWRGINKKIEELTQQIEKERVSIGEIIEITGDSTNPATLKGYGVWESFGAGLVTVGVGSYADSRGENKSWSDGQTEGEYKHEQTESELATHSHSVSGATDDDSHNHSYSGTTDSDTHNHTFSKSDYSNDNSGPLSLGGDGSIESYSTTSDTHNHTYSGTTATDSHSHSVTGTAGNVGNSEAMNNTQPTIAVYRWKRTA